MKTANQIDAEWNRVVLDLFQGCPCAFLTGSRAFGWHTRDSDYDVCILVSDKKKADGIVQTLSEEYKESEYYSSSKGSGIRLHDSRGHYRTVTINPIPLHPLDMLCWWLATREIRHIATIDPRRIGDREFKHGAFELLRGFYKTMIRYDGAEAILEHLKREQALGRAW